MKIFFISFILSALIVPISMAAPNNDDLANATNISTLPTSLQQDSTGATNEINEAGPTCLNNEPSPSVWFKYTASASQTVVFDTFGSDYDTNISIWNNNEHPLIPMDCNDDHSNLEQSLINAELKAGITYYINVGGYNGEGGNLTLNAKQVNALTNDNLANAIAIGDDSTYSNTQTTKSATIETGETIASCNKNGATSSVWYKYSPSANQRAVFNTSGSDYNTVLSVWSGATHPLTEVECNDDNGGPQSQIAANLTANKIYYINVATGKTSPGAISEDTGLLNFSMSTPPINDNIADAIQISEAFPYTNTQNTGGATTEKNESNPSCATSSDASIWYLFNPSSDYNNVTFSIPNASFDAALSIWQGSEFPLTELACSDNAVTPDNTVESQITIPLKANTDYYVDINGVDGESGTTTLQVEEGKTDFAIAAQPQPQTVGGCQNATLTVVLNNNEGKVIEATDDPVGNQWETGVTLPFSYEWYQGESGDDSNLVSEVENNPVVSVKPDTTSNYWVRVTNPTGSVDSAATTVTVDDSVNNGAGLDVNGNSMSTKAHFCGSVTESLQSKVNLTSITQQDNAVIRFTINVDPKHVKKTADVLMLGVYKNDNVTQYYMRNGSNWELWNGDIASFAAAQTDVNLPESFEIIIYDGLLAGLPGSLEVYSGYRFENGGIFYSGDSIKFTVK
ncbi:hypothetical protein QUF74_10175 [Candidatus Halobeggiatoa sp. HSG11]|nr:hypothetical protein [Candidatus Halobeggiatoa sp. HSG11]